MSPEPTFSPNSPSMDGGGANGVLLSICIPTFNRLPYLKQIIGELLPQIKTVCDGRVELLVSDNCSTDGTSEYLAGLHVSVLRFWTNDVNIGGDRNFLRCIREARGEYVWLMGDDDLISADGVAHVISSLQEKSPDLLIADEFNRGYREYADYRSCLVGEKGSKPLFALAHTLISANIFRRSLFDIGYAESKLWTSYAHMFGFVGNITGKVILLPHVLSTREVRADFAQYPSFLCVKHGIYLWWLARGQSLPAYRWKAIKSVCNLPLEFGSRVKYYLKKLTCRRNVEKG